MFFVFDPKIKSIQSENCMDYLSYLKNKFSFKDNEKLTITILSPYLSEKFLQRLIEQYPSSQLFIITDRWGELKVEKINEKIKKEEKPKNIKKIHLAKPESGGILHAKLFLFTGKCLSTEKQKTILLWGSGNATDSAFGENNAEVYKLVYCFRQ